MSTREPEEAWLLFEQDGLRAIDEAETHIIALEDGADDPQESLNGLYRSLHSLKGNARAMELSRLEALTHAAEDLVGLCREGIAAFEAQVFDLVLETTDALRDALPEVVSTHADLDTGRVSSLVERMAALVATLDPGRKGPGEQDGGVFDFEGPLDFDFDLPDDAEAPSESPEPTVGPVSAPTSAGASTPPNPASAKVLVPRDALLQVRSSKIQELLSIASDLGLSTDALLAHKEMVALRQHSEEVTELAHRLSRLMRDLRFSAAGLALVPINELFAKVRRISRELSRATGKQFKVRFSGQDTEVDKSLVDALADPVLHIIRNAVDHGLETPEERARTSKDGQGTLLVEASYSGNEVLLSFSDDGRGLDTRAIEARAVERGLIKPEHSLSEGDLNRLIFHPGFSTKGSVSELSGRGVGLDVVNQTIKDMRGRIDLESSPGAGTKLSTFLPLTLAFADALIVEIGVHLYAIPLESVGRICLPGPGDWCLNRADQAEFVEVKGAVIPIVWLGAHDQPVEPFRVRTPVVCVRSSGGELGLPVTALRGTEQITMRPLDRFARHHPAVASCGILSSGEVASTLNCEGLLALRWSNAEGTRSGVMATA